MAADSRNVDDLLGALGDANERLRSWQLELNALRQQHLRDGMSGKDAVAAMIERQKAQAQQGDLPVDHERLDEDLIELARLYRELPEAERAQVRASLQEMPQVRNQIYGTIHSIARRLRESRERLWLDLGLALAAIEGGSLDFRDLYVALGELWLAAEAVRIRPAKHFQSAAELAGDERDSLNHSGRSLLQAFPHSAHLHSIKQRR